MTSLTVLAMYPSTIELILFSIRYADPTGRERLWEAADRTTKPKGSDVDAVGIVAILEDKSASSSQSIPHLLLQKQFRPPVNKVCIEVPAGLVDPGEGPEQSAVRELKEETGYVGEVVKESWGVGHVMWNGKYLSLPFPITRPDP